jgi:hypothetical protein
MTLTEEEREILRAQHRERVARCTRDIQAHWKREAEERQEKLEEEAELKKLEEENE